MERAAADDREAMKAERTNAKVRHEALFRRIDEVASKMEAQFQRVWDELDELRTRLDVKRERLNAHDKRFDAHEQRLNAHDRLFGRVLDRLGLDGGEGGGK